MDQNTIRQIIVNFIQRTSSPDFYTNTINEYSQIFPEEDATSIKEMVLEDINRELKELNKQIALLFSGDNK